MENVLEVYKRPYDPKYPVACLDETSKQLLIEVRDPIPLEPGKPERFDTEYERNGVCNLFMIFEPLTGWRSTEVTDRRTAVDWAHQVKNLVDGRFKDAIKVTLVEDNLNTHTAASLYKAFDPEEARRIIDKLEFCYTPKHGSWLDMAEIELSILSRQCLNRRIPDKETLCREVNAWEKARNDSKSTMEWRFTTENARIKLKKLYPTLPELNESQ